MLTGGIIRFVFLSQSWNSFAMLGSCAE